MKEAKASSKKKAVENADFKATPTQIASRASATKGRATGKNTAPIETTAKKSEDSKQSPATAVDSTSQAPVVDQQPQLPATRGKVGVFGGPKDRGMKPDDKLALPTGPHGVYERVRTLNPKSFYCAMRWNYHVQHLTPEEVKRWWANKKLLVTNAKNGNAVVVRAADYGPHENTGLDISISPGASEALGVEVGDDVDISLADPKSPLGPQ
ncbi:MAG: hypothetical protein AABN33_02400 [Acidobacteriota bacterium]